MNTTATNGSRSCHRRRRVSETSPSAVVFPTPSIVFTRSLQNCSASDHSIGNLPHSDPPDAVCNLWPQNFQACESEETTTSRCGAAK
uniref:Uncharacterized protein n=1 Tax=Arundo donax TaxID=35708 RepID=A0A0A9CL74_ARUDO